MSSSESEDEQLTIFKGCRFFLHGPTKGMTKNRIRAMVQQGGGRVIEDLEDVKLSHVLLGGQIWARQSTKFADLTVKSVIKVNEENRTEADKDYNRVWLMPIEWLQACLEQKQRLPERKWDYERAGEAEKKDKSTKRKKQLDAERRANKGKSKYGRGERKAQEAQRALQQELKDEEKLFNSGDLGGGLDAFSGLPSLGSPAQAASSSSSGALPKSTFSNGGQQTLGFAPSANRWPAPKPAAPTASHSAVGAPAAYSKLASPPRTLGSGEPAVAGSDSSAASSATKIAPMTTTFSLNPFNSSPPPATSSSAALSPFSAAPKPTKSKAKQAFPPSDSSDSDAPLASRVEKGKGKGKGKAKKRRSSPDTDYASDGSSVIVEEPVPAKSSLSAGKGKKRPSTSKSKDDGPAYKKRVIPAYSSDEEE
ncbi:hypothetical protein JCM10213_006926 [Rhodosporidiobolus nylandii]